MLQKNIPKILSNKMHSEDLYHKDLSIHLSYLETYQLFDEYQ